MRKPSKSGEESGRNQELIQQLKNLEQEWENLQRGKKLPNTRRCSTGSGGSLISSFDQLFQNSPRGLMYSLQRRRSPSDGFLREKNCDMAVEEVLRERRAAIISGKLKGKRLFGEAEAVSEVELDWNYDDGSGSGGGGGGEEVCGDWLNMIREREVVINENYGRRKGQGGEDELPDSFPLSCSFSDASLSEEKEVVAEEKVVVEKRRGIGGCGRGVGCGGMCIMAMVGLVFLLILLILGLISVSCNSKSVHENELILVPT